MKVTKEPMEVLKCHECQKSFSNKKTLGDHILMVNMWRLCTTAYKAMKTPESSRWSETLAQIVI